MSEDFTLYVDGSCLGNPGPGGWGFVFFSKEGKQEKSGFFPETTNNRMEMVAVIEGLKYVPEGASAKIYTDSQYVQKGMEEWLLRWKSRGWKTASGSIVKNQDLWKELDALCAARSVAWVWVRGHCGDEGNERAHELAHAAASKKGTR